MPAIGGGTMGAVDDCMAAPTAAKASLAVRFMVAEYLPDGRREKAAEGGRWAGGGISFVVALAVHGG